MKILPVANYRVQNQNKKQQNVNFGMFRIEEENREVLEGIKELCSKYSVEIMQNFNDGWSFFLPSTLPKALEKGGWNGEVVLIFPRDFKKLTTLCERDPQKASDTLEKHLTP